MEFWFHICSLGFGSKQLEKVSAEPTNSCNTERAIGRNPGIPAEICSPEVKCCFEFQIFCLEVPNSHIFFSLTYYLFQILLYPPESTRESDDSIHHP